MAVKNIIRVAEFEKLYYDDTKPFKYKHWEALCHYHAKQITHENNGNEYFRILNKGIQFTNYVGVIQAGNLTIEILPKTHKSRTTASNCNIDELKGEEQVSRKGWHDVLLQMLKECRLLDINHVDYANLNLRSNSILEIYLELFLNEAEKLLHEGLVKKYKKTQGNSMAMKGQLVFDRHINQNLVHAERFYVRYITYSRTNLYNQLLYKTLRLVRKLTSNPYLIDKVNRLVLDFPEMPDCKASSSTFRQLTFDRKTERYREALAISKMLLLNYRPDISGGEENVLAILFDMNKLWEEFVYRRLKKAAPGGMDIKRQNKKQFWYNHISENYKTIRPDIVLTYEGKNVIVDTKWKIIDDLRPADEDLKQMFVYNLYWTSDNAALLYPGAHEAVSGSFIDYGTENLKLINHCHLHFLDILDKEKKLCGLEPFKQFLQNLYPSL